MKKKSKLSEKDKIKAMNMLMPTVMGGSALQMMAKAMETLDDEHAFVITVSKKKIDMCQAEVVHHE